MNQPRVIRCTPYWSESLEDDPLDPDSDDFLIYEDELGVRHLYDPHNALDRVPMATHRSVSA